MKTPCSMVGMLILCLCTASPVFAFNITLDTVECLNQQEPFGDDEIYFVVTEDGKESSSLGRAVIFNMRRGSKQSINVRFGASNQITVKMFEKDGDGADFLGEVSMTSSGNGDKELTGTIRGGIFRYKINWK